MMVFESRLRRPNSVVPTTRYMEASPGTQTATFTVLMGQLAGGIVGKRFLVIPTATLTPDGTNYYTLQPFYYRLDKDAGVKIPVGTARSTAALTIAAGVPFRVHEEANLRLRPGGTISVGVTATVSGTPAGATRLVLPNFIFEYGV